MTISALVIALCEVKERHGDIHVYLRVSGENMLLDHAVIMPDLNEALTSETNENILTLRPKRYV